MVPVTDLMDDGAIRPRLRVTSPLTLSRRIFAINLLSVLLVGASFLWLDSYRNQLIERRQKEVAVLADVITAALKRPSDGALVELARASDSRLRVYAADGQLVADTWRLATPNFAIARAPEGDWRKRLAARLDVLVDALVLAERPADYVEPPLDRAQAWSELNSPDATTVRLAPDRTAILTSGRALAGGRNLLVTVNARDLRRDVRAERLRLGTAVLLTLLLTTLLSTYLARTVVEPIQRLAVAARRVRLGRRRDVVVPRMADRGDEIGVLARSLADMTQALRSRSDAIENFAADVSHELKNPLASLTSAAETLALVNNPATQRQLVSVITDDARRMDRLVSDVADLSRLDARLARSRFAPVDLTPVLTEALGTMAPAAGTRSVRTAFARPRSGTAVVAGSDTQLRRAFNNLLVNALSFSPDGGLIEVRARREGAVVEVTVDDVGPGVPSEARDAIFNRFHTDRPAEHDGERHSGLGLAIVQAVVKGHGGTVAVTDRPDGARGARFVVRLSALEQAHDD